jgi:hypothetical protein
MLLAGANACGTDNGESGGADRLVVEKFAPPDGEIAARRLENRPGQLNCPLGRRNGAIGRGKTVLVAGGYVLADRNRATRAAITAT